MATGAINLILWVNWATRNRVLTDLSYYYYHLLLQPAVTLLLSALLLIRSVYSYKVKPNPFQIIMVPTEVMAIISP